MARVRVGVKRIEHGAEVPVVGADATAEVFQVWVEINGHRFDSNEIGLLDVTYGLGRSEAVRDARGDVVFDDNGRPVLEYPNSLMGEIVIRLASSSFETVDHREDERLDPEQTLEEGLAELGRHPISADD
jgi:hypothetical protein